MTDHVSEPGAARREYEAFVKDALKGTVRWERAVWHEQAVVGLADAALREADEKLAQAEAENKAQVEKTIAARQETHLEIIKRREAEAEVERLKCCGNCDHFDSFGSATYCSIECPERIHAYDHERWYGSPCQYDPTKWENVPLAEHGGGK